MDLIQKKKLIQIIIFDNNIMPEQKKGHSDKKAGGMSWMEALKAWNKKQGGKYQIPKKGSSGYNEVKAMMK